MDFSFRRGLFLLLLLLLIPGVVAAQIPDHKEVIVSPDGSVDVEVTPAGELRVSCTAGNCGGGGGASFTDNSAFTAGTTDISPVGGVFNDGLADVTSGNAAATRITADRGLHTNLRDALGNEIASAIGAQQSTDRGVLTRQFNGALTQVVATITSTTCPGSGCVTISGLEGFGSIAFTQSGTYGSVEMDFRDSLDGTLFTPTFCLRHDGSGRAVTTGIQSNQTFKWSCPLDAGVVAFRVTATSYASGTVDLRFAPAAEPLVQILPGHVTSDPLNVRLGQTGIDNDVDADIAFVAGVPVVAGAGVPVSQVLADTGTLANITSSASSVTCFSVNAARQSAVLYNDSTSAVNVKYGTTASATSFTWRIPANAHLLITGYSGRVDCIWDTANGFARVTEVD